MPLTNMCVSSPKQLYHKVDAVALARARKAEHSAWKQAIEDQVRVGEERLQALRHELSIVSRNLQDVDNTIVALQDGEQPQEGVDDFSNIVLHHSDSSDSSGSIRTEISVWLVIVQKEHLNRVLMLCCTSRLFGICSMPLKLFLTSSLQYPVRINGLFFELLKRPD